MGRHVKVHTDHKALKFISSCAQNSHRIARWLNFLQEFDLEVEHIPGKLNIIADTLSRNHQDSGHSTREADTRYVALIENQAEDTDTSTWVNLLREAQENDEDFSSGFVILATGNIQR